jgi:hypothetical protein
LINQTQYKDIVQKVEQEEGFVTQLGTVWMKKDHFGDKLLEPTPKLEIDGKFVNQKGDAFVIVHQYDREKSIKELIEKKYK